MTRFGREPAVSLNPRNVIPEGLLCRDPWRTWRSPRLDETVL